MTEENKDLSEEEMTTEDMDVSEKAMVKNKNELPEYMHDMTQTDIMEALLTTPQPPANSLEESAEELRAMGFPDISQYDEKEHMEKAMQNVQIQKTLRDLTRGSTDKRSPRTYLEQHIDFLVGISPGKTKKDVVKGMSLDHAITILKVNAKMTLPDAVVKKHLKILKKKYT